MVQADSIKASDRGQGESLVPPHTRGSVFLSLKTGGERAYGVSA